MKYFVTEIATGDSKIAGKAISEFTDRNLALASYHKKIGTALASELFETELVMCVNEYGQNVDKPFYFAKPQPEPEQAEQEQGEQEQGEA